MMSRVTFGPALKTEVDESKCAFLARSRTALVELKAIV